MGHGQRPDHGAACGGDHGPDRPRSGQRDHVLTRELREPFYERIDARATPEETTMLQRLSAETLGLTELAGEPVQAVLTTAPGDGKPSEASR